MANPQTENGYTPIANELLEQIYKNKFNATQIKIILAICRYTYGFSRKSHALSLSFLANAIGISKRYISCELKELINRGVVYVIKDCSYTETREIALNKHYEEWSSPAEQQMNSISTVEQQDYTTVDEQFYTTVEEQFHQEKQNINQNLKQKKSLLSGTAGSGSDDIEINMLEIVPMSGTMPDEIGPSQESRESLERQIDADKNSNKVAKRPRKKPHYEHDSTYYKAALWLANRIEDRVPGYKKHTESQLQEWANSARLMMERDGRDRALTNKLLLFSQEDEFWSRNILSIPKFRERFDKLLTQYLGNVAKKSRQNQASPMDTGYLKLADILEDE